MKKINWKKIQWKEKGFLAIMLVPSIVQFFIFWVYVNIDSIFMAFQVPVPNSNELTWSFANFEALFKEFSTTHSELWIALKNTLIFFFSGLFVTLPLSLLLCYFLYKKIWGYTAFRILFYLPCIIPASVTVALFRYIIAAEGPLYEVLALFGFKLPPLLQDSRYALWTIVFYGIFFGLGGNLVLFGGAMNQINKELVESATIDGVTMLKEIIYIIIPLMWPTLSTVMIFGFVGLFGASGPILLFTGGAYKTDTISFWIFRKVQGEQSLYYPAATGLFFTFIGAPIALIMRKILNKGVDDVTL